MTRNAHSLLTITFLALAHLFATTVAAGETVHVSLDEWGITVDRDAVDAGKVTFHATNAGDETHELVLIRTRHTHDKLPIEQGKVSEEAAGELIGEIEEFAPGETHEATFTLEPGEYVLICNIVEEEADGSLESHYHEGMHIPFKVR